MTVRMGTGATGSARQGLGVVVLGLALLMGLALAIRAMGFEFVFVGDQVVFPPADAQYHLRRAFYSFANFPAVLLFDPYINYPGGAPVPWPPLFDFLVGAVARALADDPRGFETVAAWSGPFCALLTLVPLYRAGCLLGSRGVGFAAALCYACLPISVAYSRVGNPDHHAAVAMLGAWLLLACLGLVEAAAADRRVRGWGLLLAGAQFALLLTWHGSLLYLAIANGLLLAAAVAGGSLAALRAQASAALACAAGLAPIVFLSPLALGGPFSSIALSWLHVLATLAVASVVAGLWAAARWDPGAGPARRLAMATLGGVLFLSAAALIPALREGLWPAFQFLSQADQVGAVTGEQNPLFGVAAGRVGANPMRSWGWLAYAIPFAPWVALWAWASPRNPGRCGPGLVLLAGWALFFAALTLDQRRYGNDFAPAFSLLFGLAALGVLQRPAVGASGARWREAIRAVGVGALLIALLWPAINAVYGPRARASLTALESGRPPSLQAKRSVAASLAGFMAEVRRVTPETGAYLTPGPDPAYGIIAHANLGHAIQYGARRATATDPFWWYIGRENWDASFAFLAARGESEALAWAEVLKGRYLITHAEEAKGSVAQRLHAGEGAAEPGRPALTHFRLIVEATPGGRGVGEIFRPRRDERAPYKLFEIVPGAELVIETGAGERVSLLLDLRSNQGRRFQYRAGAVADAKGEARLRVPYSTEVAPAPGAPRRTVALGLYRVESGGRVEALRVSEDAVLGGEEVRLRLR